MFSCEPGTRSKTHAERAVLQYFINIIYNKQCYFPFFIQYFIRQCHLLMAMPINVDVVVVDFAAEKGKNPNPDHRQTKLNMRVRAVA